MGMRRYNLMKPTSSRNERLSYPVVDSCTDVQLSGTKDVGAFGKETRPHTRSDQPG